ncbi:hypothetical protein Ccrd_025225 [Cynara cardunculus var. scolymus]|uniref:Uncharacterized protein n=1 Tax=Cynara cardunculus var. scolymus TaxID=59895 RepID=A0A103XB78_CYNCS|nr:hypothetical protein Ccrd_025225 [Cynara cardunculus var. scolymus]
MLKSVNGILVPVYYKPLLPMSSSNKGSNYIYCFSKGACCLLPSLWQTACYRCTPDVATYLMLGNYLMKCLEGIALPGTPSSKAMSNHE